MKTTHQDYSDLILLDGGMGRELDRVGAPFRQPEWSALALIETPKLVKEVHRSFALAGSDMLTTSNYAVVPFHIGEKRFLKEGRALNARAAKLTKEVADQYGRKVLGALPPLFGSYRPDLFNKELAKSYLEILIDGLQPYVDVWLAETVSSIDEAVFILNAVQKDRRPVWISFTIQDNPEQSSIEPLLRSGESVLSGVKVVLEHDAAAILFNCSQPEVMLDAVKLAGNEIRQQSKSVLLGVYANAFPRLQKEIQANDGLQEIREDLGPDDYLRFVKQWYSHGATIIGGCCGIGPEHIAVIDTVRQR